MIHLKKYISQFCYILLMLCSILIIFNNSIYAQETANLSKTELKDGFHDSNYKITIEKFEVPMNQDEIKNSIMVLNDKGGLMPINHLEYVGTNKDGKSSGAIAYGDFNPNNANYKILIKYPNGNERNINIDISKELKDQTVPLREISKRLSFNIDPVLANSLKEDIGIKYNCNLKLYSDNIPKLLYNFEITSSGEITINNKNNLLQNNLLMGISGQLLYIIDLPTIGNQRQIYPIGLRIKPCEFETTTKFNKVYYTVKPQIAMAIPYLDFISSGWSHLLGLNRMYLPPTIFIGYTNSYKLKDDQSIKDKMNNLANDKIEMIHRLDGELVYVLPLASFIDFNLRWRFYLNINKTKEFKNLLELALNIYFNKDRNVGLHIGYQRGELPPLFKKSTTFLGGFTIAFQ